MPRQNYQQQLDDLRADILLLGEDVREQLDRAVSIIEAPDSVPLYRIETAEEAINDRYLALEGDCITLIARQQPVAGDLRFIAASYKILTDLERIADVALVLIRRAVSGGVSEGGLGVAPIDLVGMTCQSHEMVTDAMDAYARMDVNACYEIVARDDAVDQLAQRASEQAFEHTLTAAQEDSKRTSRLVEETIGWLLTVRDLEVIADHAVNICARTVYMATNDDELMR